MVRLIDANALIAEYDRVHTGPPGRARTLMEDAPTVDAVGGVHGRWIEVNKCRYPDGHIECDYKCSICGEISWGESNYCPDCGAKMDGDGNG